MTKSTHPARPLQLRLPGQAAAAEGPVDLTMMYVMHHAFRRDLACFAAATAATPVADREPWEAMANRWELFAAALHHHHSGEDAGLWPLLHERATDSEREVLRCMADEHAEIDPLLESCEAGFRRLARHADEDARRALGVRLVAARERLGHHLDHEETGAIPILQRVLTQADWERVEAEHFRPGLGFCDLLVLVPWALDGLPSTARRTLFEAPGGGVHRLLWLLTRRRYQRRTAVAFRYLP